MYNTESVLHNVGLDRLFDEKLKVPYYPFLVYLFYANLSTISSADGSLTITSSVKNAEIAFSANELAEILNIPTSDVSLMSVDVSNPDINPLLFKPDCTYPMNNNSLNPNARLIAKIVAQNLIPKTGSFDHFASDKINAVYAIFAQIKVDWATVFINNMASKHTKFLPFGSFLTHIFKHFNVDLTNEPKVESKRDFFDKVSLSRMQLALDSIPSSSSRSQSRVSSSSASDVCDRLDRLEIQVSSIQRDVRKILSYQRQSLNIPDHSSSSDSDRGTADGSGSSDSKDDGKGDRDSEGGEDELSSFL